VSQPSALPPKTFDSLTAISGEIPRYAGIFTRELPRKWNTSGVEARGALYAGMVLMKYRTVGRCYRLNLELRDPARSAEHLAVWLGVKVFGGSAESWLTQQAHYDLAQVHADRIKLKRLELTVGLSS